MILFLLGYDVILYQDGTYPYAVYEREFYEYFNGELPLIDSLNCWDKYRDKNLLILMTQKDVGKVKELIGMFPIEFKRDTVFFPDTLFIAWDYIFVGRFNNPFNKDKEIIIEVGNTVEALGGAREPKSNGFTLSRKRDGIMYEDDFSAIGEWQWRGNGLEITRINWISHPERHLLKKAWKHIKVYYDSNLFTSREALKFLKLMNSMYMVYDSIYSIPMPETVYVYIYLSKDDKIKYTLYSIPFNTIWCKVESREGFFRAVRHRIVSFAHEMARISFQPISKEYPPSIGADDWSQYAPMVGVVPYIDSIYGDTAWFYPVPYQKDGLPLFLNLIKGVKWTYESILYEIDRKYGKGIIGKAISRSIPSPYFRLVDIKVFMDTLGSLVRDEGIRERIKRGIPTPFHHSLYRWKRWKPMGITPSLDDMFFKSRFCVEAVEKGSVADSLGIKPGDVLMEVEGYSVEREKEWAYRSLLLKKEGEGVRMVFKRKNRKRIINYVPGVIK
ncbi:MAG: hypothetical protein DRP55_02020 [Spirochaetes bacterium]|nr:MAG: hypothetical protein DRP55_02020 [Spirochaetota bacterium]